MAHAYKLLPHYTYEDYLHWEGRWEVIDGIPYAMSPQPRPEHQTITGSLHSELRMALKKSGCQCKVYQPIDYKISEDTILNPDISIVCRPITKGFIDFPPHLVVEILSPSTALKDRHTKFQLYQTEGIQYYLIVDIDKQVVEVYRLVESNYELQSVNSKEPFTFAWEQCSFDVTFDNIWD